jgi:hypothetical protein
LSWDPVIRQRRPGDVAAKLFKPISVVCLASNRGVQAETVDVGAQSWAHYGLAWHRTPESIPGPCRRPALAEKRPNLGHSTMRTVLFLMSQHLLPGAGSEGDAAGCRAKFPACGGLSGGGFIPRPTLAQSLIMPNASTDLLADIGSWLQAAIKTSSVASLKR